MQTHRHTPAAAIEVQMCTHTHTYIFTLANTQREEGEGGTEATEHTTKSKQTALSYELG